MSGAARGSGSSFFFFFFFLRAAPSAYGGSQTRGQIGAIATSLSHSNTGSDRRLQPTPQLLATPDPQTTEQGQRIKPIWILVRFISTEPQGELLLPDFMLDFILFFFLFGHPTTRGIPGPGIRSELQL